MSLGKAIAGAGGSPPSLREKPAGAQSPKGSPVTSCSSHSGLRTEKPQLTLNKAHRAETSRPLASRCALQAPRSTYTTPPPFHRLRIRESGPQGNTCFWEDGDVMTHFTSWPHVSLGPQSLKKMANPKFPPQYAYEMSHLELKRKPYRPGWGTGVGAEGSADRKNRLSPI